MAASALVWSTLSAAQAEADLSETLDAALDAAVDAQVEAGFTGYVMLQSDGKTLLSRGVGVADAITGRPIDANTQLDMVSMSKTVTGALIAEEIAAGRLRADDTLGGLLDVDGTRIADITLHQLLTHTAGLVDVLGHDHEQVALDTVVQRATATELLSRPGSAYRYSNLGYSLLAAVLERHTGESFSVLLAERMTALGLSVTGYASAFDAANTIRRGTGETVRDEAWGGDVPGANLIGNGGMMSTAAELAALFSAYSRGDFISPEARDLARTPHVDETGEGFSYYGYGLVVETDPRLGTIYWHNGGSRYFNAHWRELADHDVLIIVLSDQPPAAADRMVMALQRALMSSGALD